MSKIKEYEDRVYQEEPVRELCDPAYTPKKYVWVVLGLIPASTGAFIETIIGIYSNFTRAKDALTSIEEVMELVYDKIIIARYFLNE